MNKIYLISYDLKTPNRDYGPLIEAIKRSPKWLNPLESTWLIVTSETANQIWSRLGSLITQSDRLLIIGVTDEFYGWLSKEQWEWIVANKPKSLG